MTQEEDLPYQPRYQGEAVRQGQKMMSIEVEKGGIKRVQKAKNEGGTGRSYAQCQLEKL
jgi:hypothetical protein